MKTIPLIAVTVVVSGLWTACATKREIIALELPTPPLGTQKGIQVVLNIAEDARTFNEGAGSPAAPSLRSRPSDAAALQARTVGRKRNMYNDPEGEWLLEPNKTVATLVSSFTESALRAEGYDVQTDPLNAREGSVTLDISVKEFWAWCQADAFKTTIHVRIAAALRFKPSSSASRTLQVEALREVRVPGKYDWQIALQDAHDRYIVALREMLAKNPLEPPKEEFDEAAVSSTVASEEAPASPLSVNEVAPMDTDSSDELNQTQDTNAAP